MFTGKYQGIFFSDSTDERPICAARAENVPSDMSTQRHCRTDSHSLIESFTGHSLDSIGCSLF